MKGEHSGTHTHSHSTLWLTCAHSENS